MSAWIQSDLVQSSFVQGNVEGEWQLAWPNELVPVKIWVPAFGPIQGSKPGRLGRTMQQTLMSGRPIGYTRGPQQRRWSFLFRAQSWAEYDAREEFFAAARETSFRVQPLKPAGWFTVVFTGASLNFDPTNTPGDLFDWDEEFIEVP